MGQDNLIHLHSLRQVEESVEGKQTHHGRLEKEIVQPTLFHLQSGSNIRKDSKLCYHRCQLKTMV